MKSCDLLYFTVRIGKFRARMTLRVVQNLDVDCLLGTTSSDHHEKPILPRLQKIVLYRNLSGALTAHRSPDEPKTFLSLKLEDEFQKTWTTQRVAIPPLLQAKMQAQRQTGGFALARIPRDSLLDISH